MHSHLNYLSLSFSGELLTAGDPYLYDLTNEAHPHISHGPKLKELLFMIFYFNQICQYLQSQPRAGKCFFPFVMADLHLRFPL